MAPPRFVLQEHWATAHHFDFRLEVDGVLRSWAVPKGPSTAVGERRLAVQVPDHDLAHADYEGPTVIIRDAGTFRSLDPDRSLAEQLDAGHAKFWLDGEHLKGGWTLHRTTDGAKPQWLLLKRKDDPA